MNSSANADLLRTLRAFRRRMLTTVFLEKLTAAALIVGAALVMLSALNRWLFHDSSAPASVLFGAALATLSLAVLGTLANRWSLSRVASVVDELGQTRDRLVTALAFSRKSERPEPMRALAEAECGDFVRRADLRRLVRVQPPRAAVWLVVPLVTWLFLQWDFHLATTRQQARAAATQSEIVGTVRQLEHLARETERASEQASSAELREIAEQLRRSVERLRAETNSDEAQKAALRELSGLEQAMREMQRQPSPTEEMKELAKALSPAPGMSDVLRALDENNLAAAAEALESAEKQSSEDAPKQTEEQVQRALEKALERLGQQRQLSAALQKLAAQVRQHSGGQTKSAMQQLREMIQQAQRAGSPSAGKGGQPMSIEQLIAALENMKYGEGQPGGSSATESQGSGGDPRISVEAFGASAAKGDPQSAHGRDPGGQPGSENDFGTTENPFGAKSDLTDKGADIALKGRLADGESLSTMLPAAGDKSKSTLRYKELYEALAPAAENAVQQEAIPLGSRFYIKRYFESIRPRE